MNEPPRLVAVCFVCGQNRPCEKDHAIPRSAGGSNAGTIPLCRGCHDQLDRQPLDRWQWGESSLRVMMSVWGRLSFEERLLVAKLVRIAAVAVHAQLAVHAQALDADKEG